MSYCLLGAATYLAQDTLRTQLALESLGGRQCYKKSTSVAHLSLTVAQEAGSTSALFPRRFSDLSENKAAALQSQNSVPKPRQGSNGPPRAEP